MSRPSPLVRNLLGVAVVALVLTLALGNDSSRVIGVLFSIVNVAFAIGLAYLGYTVWRRNRGTFSLMPSSHRLALYACAAGLLLLLVTSWFWVTTALTSLVFFALAVALGYGLWRLWQESRRYYY